MKNTKCVLFFLVSNIIMPASRAEDLDFTATTLSKSSPNTFIGTTRDQIASSLLPSKTPAILWGLVPANVITTVCNEIVSTGRLQYTARISDGWGITESLTLAVIATGGCGAAPDSSGTEFVFADKYDRKSAVVCPQNSGTIGCGVYMTGSDVSDIYDKRFEDKNLLGQNASAYFDCSDGAGKGAIGGAVNGILAIGDCLALGALAPFCVAGVLGVTASLGALAGCISSSCFPGDATVQMSNGETKMMSQLQIGDKVGTLESNGELGFSEIYAFGHQNIDQTIHFINLKTSDSKTLQLSPLHFVPTLIPRGEQVRFKRAKDVLVGDVLLTASIQFSNNSLLPHSVTKVSTVVKPGLFNPLTIQGTIVVNGVVASVYSDWFLDPLFDALGLTARLPDAYQAILFPARLLYALLGDELYRALYEWLHARIDIAEFGRGNGGNIAAACLVASGIASMKLLRRKQ